MHVEEGQLRDFLLSMGALSRRSLEEALRAKEEGEALAQALVVRGYISDDDLRRALAHLTGTPFIVLTRDLIDPAAMMVIPEPVARAHNVVGFRFLNDALEVAMLDLDALRELDTLGLPYKLAPRITTQTSVKHGLLFYQKLLKEKFSRLLETSGHAVEALIHHALLSRAHGIHIDISMAQTLVRYRIGSALHEAMQLPTHIGAAMVERLKSLAKLLPFSSTLQEGRFKFEKDGDYHTVHVAALPTVGGERLTLRLMRENSGQHGFALSSLGLHGESLERIHKLLCEKSGIILVAAPQGGGKTTTLYTLLDQYAHRDLAVATIEEKIEHHFPHVAQTQVSPEMGLSYSAGLRAALRQDPDVVMVGELKDLDTSTLAAIAASRGVLVLAGIEAPSAVQAIEKLRAWGVPALTLGATLKGVIGTAVVGRLCAHEREEYRLARAEGAPLEPYANFGRVLGVLKEEGIVESNKQWKELLFSRATTCQHCTSGYTGLVGLQEVLPITATIKELLLSGASPEDIERQAREEGMLTIVEDGLFKAAQGITGIEELFRLAQDGQ